MRLNKNIIRSNIKSIRFFDILLPILIASLVIIFIIYPVFSLLETTVNIDGSFSLARYKNLMSDNIVIFKNSIFSSALSSILATVLALCIALCVTMAGKRLRAALMAILLVAMVSPPFIGSLAYIQLYGRRGWITHSILGLSLNPYNWYGVVLMQAISFAPLGALFMVGILDKVDMGLLKAARDLGSKPTRAIKDILFPIIRPGITANLLLAFIRALADFGTPIVIGGRFNTVASEIYMQITGYANLPYAATLNMLLFIPAIIIFGVYRWLMKRSDKLLTYTGVGNTAEMLLESGRGFKIFINTISGIFFSVLTLQYISIFAGGFIKGVRGKYHFTWEHLQRVITFDLSSLYRSILYSLFVGIVGTLFAMVLAYYIERRKIPGRNILDFSVTIPYMIPGTCFGIAYLLAFSDGPLKLVGGASIVILNMLFRQLPNTSKIVGASLAQIPYSLEDAARDLGAGPLRVIRSIILPNLKGAFFSGFVYNFTSSMTTAGSILFLIQSEKKVAVFRLFDAINTAEYGVASILSAMIILVSLFVNIGILFLTSNRKGGTRIVSTVK